MKTMIKTMTGAFILVFAQVALAVCPANCECEKCAAKPAEAQCGADCKKECCAGKADKDKKKCCELSAVPEGLERAVYKISGMTCKECAAAVTKSVDKVEGATVQTVCVKSGTVVVHYDPKKVEKKAIAAALNQGKFKVVVKKACAADCKEACCADKKACPADGKKACCADKKACPADCKEACCADKKACPADCTKPCCAVKKAE